MSEQDEPLSPRPKLPSFEEILAKEVAREIVSQSGQHRAVTTSVPPSLIPIVLWIQRWWLRVSVAFVLWLFGEVLHEYLARLLHWR